MLGYRSFIRLLSSSALLCSKSCSCSWKPVFGLAIFLPTRTTRSASRQLMCETLMMYAMLNTRKKYGLIKYHREVVEFVCLPNRHTPTHAGEAVDQHIAVLAKASAMYEVIAHRKILCEILKNGISTWSRWPVGSALPGLDYRQP